MEARRGKQDHQISPEKFQVSHPSNPRVCLWLQRNGFQRKTPSFAERLKLIGRLSQDKSSKQVSVGLGGAKQMTERRELVTAPRASRSFLVNQFKAKDSSADDRQQRKDAGEQGYIVMQGHRKVWAPHEGNYTRRRTQSMPTPTIQPLLKRELGNLPCIPRNNGSVHVKNNYTSLRKYNLTNIPTDEFDWRRIPECRLKSDGEEDAGTNIRNRLRAQDNFDSNISKIDTERGEKLGKDIEKVCAVDKASKTRKVQLPTGLDLTLELRRASVLNEPQTSHHDQLSPPTVNPDHNCSDGTSSDDQSAFYYDGHVDSLQSYSFECTSRPSPVDGVSKSAMYASKSNILSWLQDVQQYSTFTTC